MLKRLSLIVSGAPCYVYKTIEQYTIGKYCFFLLEIDVNVVQQHVMRYTLQFVGSEHGAIVSLARVVEMLMLIFSVIPTLALVLKYFFQR